MGAIKENLKYVHDKIENSCIRNKEEIRDKDEVNLIAVSKRQTPTKIQEILNCGQRIFGENRIQEAQEHWQGLRESYTDLQLHLIGPLQTNKVKEAVALFDMIQSVDRPKLVHALAKEMTKQEKNIPCLIQVNTGEEPQKSGILPHELEDFLTLCRNEGLTIIGLMCIPPQNEPPALHFAFLKKLADQYDLKELSMGMSSDFEKAIPLGATYIRVGTALFGERTTP